MTGMAVQVGCLMLATDRVLTPWVRNTEVSDSCVKLRFLNNPVQIATADDSNDFAGSQRHN